MRTTFDLMAITKNILESNGFKTDPSHAINHKPYEFHATATKDDKSYYNTKDGIEGYEIDFSVVHRHNGTAENQSVDVRIIKWENSMGKTIYKERLSTKHSDKQIMNRLQKIVHEYENL